jgi:hypothetical protein
MAAVFQNHPWGNLLAAILANGGVLAMHVTGKGTRPNATVPEGASVNAHFYSRMVFMLQVGTCQGRTGPVSMVVRAAVHENVGGRGFHRFDGTERAPGTVYVLLMRQLMHLNSRGYILVRCCWGHIQFPSLLGRDRLALHAAHGRSLLLTRVATACRVPAGSGLVSRAP